MYKSQGGCLPIFISLLGLAILVFCFINISVSIGVLIQSIVSQKNIIEPILFSLLFLSACFFGLALIGFFPALHVTDDGIAVRYLFGLIKVNIFWKDIVYFQQHQIFRKIMIISFKKESYSILFPKTLIFNAVCGLWVGSEFPVLLLYKPDEYDDLYQEIKKRINK